MNALSPKQRQAAQFIAAGHTHRQAATAVKVTPQTVSEWVGRPDFRAFVDSLLVAAEAETATALKGLRLRAVERLGELLENKSPGIALRAVQTALELTTTSNPPPSPPLPPSDAGAWTAIIARITAYEAEKPTKLH